MDTGTFGTSSAPPDDVVVCWNPDEGEPVSVLDYPSPVPLGVIDWIERDHTGAPTLYWVWMLDGCRICMEAGSVATRLARP